MPRPKKFNKRTRQFLYELKKFLDEQHIDIYLSEGDQCIPDVFLFLGERIYVRLDDAVRYMDSIKEVKVQESIIKQYETLTKSQYIGYTESFGLYMFALTESEIVSTTKVKFISADDLKKAVDKEQSD